MQPILEIQSLQKTYTKGPVEIHALRGITLRVAQREFVSIVGRSGSGKSTLLNIIGGLDSATQGRIQVEGRELNRLNRTELALHRRHTVGMIFQSFNLIPSRTALENVTLALTFGGVSRRDRRQRALDMITAVGLKQRMDHTPGELSGGEAQRIAIARALANRPRVLLADEPTGNLDSKTSEEIITLLRDLNRNQGITVIMVTHDEESAKAVSHRLLRLLDGRIVHEEKLGEPA
jgi:putative ABC transport system ATP-binding protein